MATKSNYACLIIFSVLLHLAGYYLLLNKTGPFLFYFYVFAWWSYIFFIDTLIALKTKRFLVINKRLPFLVIVSCGFWCFFEIMNIRLQNWFYVSLPENLFHRYLGYILAYGTVIPAIYATQKLIATLLGSITIKPFSLGRYSRSFIFAGIIIFFLIWLLSDYLFPFTWFFLLLILDGFNYGCGYNSFIKDFEEGSATNFTATLLSGLICGILWETWNAFSVSKWIYSVPFLEDVKIFEMPVPGYIGFPVFALETIAFVNLLRGIRSYRLSLIFAAIGIVLSVISFRLIDRYTVFSFAPKITDVQFIGKEKIDYLAKSGISTTFEIKDGLLDSKEKEEIELLHLKGLGHKNYLKLKSHGIGSIETLSKLSDTELSRILDEKNLRRIRVYLKAARHALKSGAH